MTSYDDRLKAWRTDVAAIPLPGADHSLDLVITVLEKQLDRATAAIKTNDDKAGLVIPGVAAITGIVGSNVRGDIASQAGLAIIGALAAVTAVAAVCLAIYALRPQSLGNGVEPIMALRGAGAPSTDGKFAYAKSLGWAVASAEQLTRTKSFGVNWAFRVGAVGVVLLTVFTALGGFAAQGGPKS